jgi:hypothetical protein
MSDQFSMFDLPTWPGLRNAISSQASADGPTHCGLPDGPMIGQSGRDRALVSRLALQGRGKHLTTKDTFGQFGPASSASAALQSSLANKLQASLGCNGSTLYRLTWKQKATPSGRQYCQLAASAHRTSGAAFGGLPTPSGTSNHGKNHVAGRLDEWGGSSNPFRGTPLGKVHCPAFEFWMMGYPEAWQKLTPPATPSSRKSRRNL